MKATFVPNQPYPTWEFDLGKMNHYSEILDEMKSLGITDYVYTFEFTGNIIKHGLSTPKKPRGQLGERIYRQAGNLNGWNKKLTGPNGKDMDEIDAEYFKQTGHHLNRKGMKITVRDLTNVKSPTVTDDKWHVKQLESELIQQHIDQFGKKPIGNINDQSYIINKPFINSKLWDNLFLFELEDA
jgi:hypothetical protein